MHKGLAAAGIVCTAYGLVVLAARSGTWFFAVWLVLGALLLAAARVVHAGAWHAAPRAAKRACATVAAVALAGFLATQALIATQFGATGEPDLDYLVVLGAQVREDGPSEVLRFRLDAAASYLLANPRTVVVVTGGQGRNEPEPEASAMARYLQERGVDANRIVREPSSTSTRENIGNAIKAAAIDPQRSRVGIVTNDFHVFRGVGIARKLGIEHACGLAGASAPLFLPNNLVRESLGIAKDFAVGNL